MRKNVFPLGVTNFDLSTLRSLMSGFSSLSLSTETKGDSEAVVVLSKMLNHSITNEQLLAKHSSAILGHLHWTFAVACNWTFIENLGLVSPRVKFSIFVSDKHQDAYMVILTADLQTWKSLCIEYCTEGTQIDFRWIFNQVWSVLSATYVDVFSSHSPSSLQDQTFWLQPKQH